MQRTIFVSLSLFIIYLLLLVWMLYFSNQSNFTANIMAYSGMFACYILLLFKSKKHDRKTITTGLIILHLIPLFVIPPLSPDIYRFLWDGEIILQGVNPYAFTPDALIKQDDFQFTAYLQRLFNEMTLLSRSNYSPYPSSNQFYFIISNLFTDHLLTNIIILRGLVIGTHILGFYYLKKLLTHLKISPNKVLILAINPFIIIELVGNLHFEGVVFSWLLMGIYFIHKKQVLKASLFWSIAITIKLTPLLLVPFFFKYLGWKKWLEFGMLTGIGSAIILGIFLWPSVLDNFFQSLTLYFNNFEFNASLFLLVKLLFSPLFGSETVAIIGPLLSIVALFLILSLALTVKKNNSKDVFVKMVYAYVLYLLLSTTIHPWYVMIPLGLSIFTRSTFMIFWSYTIMFSYIFYPLGDHFLWYVLLIIEYILLLAIFTYEHLTKKPALPLKEIE